MQCKKNYSHQEKTIVPFSMNRELMTVAIIAEKNLQNVTTVQARSIGGSLTPTQPPTFWLACKQLRLKVIGRKLTVKFEVEVIYTASSTLPPPPHHPHTHKLGFLRLLKSVKYLPLFFLGRDFFDDSPTPTFKNDASCLR